jgi:hypothetical protein
MKFYMSNVFQQGGMGYLVELTRFDKFLVLNYNPGIRDKHKSIVLET